MLCRLSRCIGFVLQKACMNSRAICQVAPRQAPHTHSKKRPSRTIDGHFLGMQTPRLCIYVYKEMDANF